MFSFQQTVFAVAINKMYKDIKNWYGKPDPTIRTNDARTDRIEPRGINIEFPSPPDKNDAALLTLILRSETRGLAGFGKAATSGTIPVGQGWGHLRPIPPG